MTVPPINLTQLRERAGLASDPSHVPVTRSEVLALIDTAEAAQALFIGPLDNPMNNYAGDPHGITNEIRTLAETLARYTTD